MPMRINIPPTTRLLLGLLLLLSLLTGAIRYIQWARIHAGSTLEPGLPPSAIPVPYLALSPALAIFYPWVFVTSVLVESNIFALAISAVTILYGGRYLERAWGSAELVKFLVLLAVIPNFIACLLAILWHGITSKGLGSLSTISGAVALQSAFLVAFKQLVPEHTVAIAKGLIKMRVKHFPLLFLLGHTIVAGVFGTYVSVILAWTGFLTGWIYLRFYKFSPDLSSTATGRTMGIRGDASETFSFATFFPEPISFGIAAVTDRVYDVLVAARICTPFSAEDVEVGNEQAMAREEGGLPTVANGAGGRPSVRGGGKREEAERRRALALKALDQRLHAAASRGQPAASRGSSVPPESSRPSESRSDQADRSNGETS
ncbi:MAG: hypothetical protein M1823_003715 [Watsoniomyces obsoletus]|nr:MAG: hypothetical protein M1823_003715 [Watsoniomyces obsoletus]